MTGRATAPASATIKDQAPATRLFAQHRLGLWSANANARPASSTPVSRFPSHHLFFPVCSPFVWAAITGRYYLSLLSLFRLSSHRSPCPPATATLFSPAHCFSDSYDDSIVLGCSSNNRSGPCLVLYFPLSSHSRLPCDTEISLGGRRFRFVSPRQFHRFAPFSACPTASRFLPHSSLSSSDDLPHCLGNPLFLVTGLQTDRISSGGAGHLRSPRPSGSGSDDFQSSSRPQPRLQQRQRTPSAPSDKVSSLSSLPQSRNTASPLQTPSSPRPEPETPTAAASIGRARSAISALSEQLPPSVVSALGTSHSSARRRSAAHRYYQLSQQNLTEVDDNSTTQPNRDSFPPAFSPKDRDVSTAHPVVRVSKRTHGAILYALEEALRYPNPFTPDLAEESANMADLLAAGGGAIPHAHRGPAPPTTGAAPLRPSAAPVPTSSPSGIRGPRMIMMERAAREARREAAEKQRIEQARAEEEARQLEEMRRQNTEQQSAGVTDGRPANIAQQQAAEAAAQRQAQASQERTRAHQRIPSHTQPAQAPPATVATQQPPSQAYLSQGSAAQQRRASESRPEPAPAAATEPAKPRSSFPHAFERWETLSAHWEGLTSYWIRKLEQNKDDVNRDPLSQQLARQVTDLSAAGANLFHAVVELQRLRASSERKFQRWFFETRSELERAQEVNALLEKALEKERRERSDAIRDAVDHERGVSKTQKQLQEMRKELAISKEEARRAWEELGRREQEERDRTLSLQSGHPTIVGGVQVVPMTQSHSTRQTSSRDPGNYQHADVSRTPTEHRSPVAPGGAGGYYAQPEGSGAGQPGVSASTPQDEIVYRESEYVLDAQGQPILDVHGKKIPTYVPPSTYSGSEQEAEEYETPATTNPPSGGHETPASGAPSGGSHSNNNNNGQWTGAYSNPQDYSGEGYGAPAWDTVQRHHHPSRLSDVMEEDERSRASTSQIGRI